jgi:alcohol dehydrogenase class IV
MSQQIRTWIDDEQSFKKLLAILQANHVKNPLIVCDQYWSDKSIVSDLLSEPSLAVQVFAAFKSNPVWDSVVNGRQIYQQHRCDGIISIGGGSAIDVGKGIKAFLSGQNSPDITNRDLAPAPIFNLAIPTTAGTGSEATHFAVIYYQGEKKSIDHPQLLPTAVLFMPALLINLPLYQRQAGMMDAFSQAIESYWSVRSNDESRKYSSQAIKIILQFADEFLADSTLGNQKMLRAADLAGQAINLTTTTAAHAMSYKLTSNYHLAHGHAVGICLPAVWEYMLKHEELATNGIGKKVILERFQEISVLLHCATPLAAVAFIRSFLQKLDLKAPVVKDQTAISQLALAVNSQRLGNNPLKLQTKDLFQIYKNILQG